MSSAYLSNQKLHLASLEIRNFRTFSHLSIEKLGRVNLITGKNNVGKSALLEAIWLYAEKGKPSVVANLLRSRNELSAPSNQFRLQMSATEAQLTNIRYLFHGRNTSLHQDDESVTISIGEFNETPLSMTVDWFGKSSSADKTEDNFRGIKEGTPQVIVKREDHYLFSYTVEQMIKGSILMEIDGEAIPCRMVWPNGFGLAISGLWDSITFTESESEVLEALRIVANSIERVNLIGDVDSSKNRVPVVKMSGIDGPIPLRSLGEGMSRIFGLSLALVTCKNGILLADEIDTGIHYSVLPDIWRFISKLAKKLNVQVFATTHSWDCIEAFQTASAEEPDTDGGVLVQLRNKSGNVVATVHDESDLAIITRDGIEVR